MKKIHNTTEYFLVAVVAFAMAVIPFIHYFCTINYLPYSVIAKNIYRTAALCLIFIFINAVLTEKKIAFTLYEYVFTALAVLLFLSVSNAADFQLAVRGANGRNEGMIMLFSYYTLFYTARFISNEKCRKALINIFLVIIAIHSMYGMCQFFDIKIGVVMDSYHYAISGVTGNPNFMGSLMTLAAGTAAGMFYYTDNKKYKAIYLMLLILFSATLVLTRTFSAYLGIAAAFIVLFVFILMDIYRKKGAKAVVGLSVALAALSIAAFVTADKMLYGLITKEINNAWQQLHVFFTTGYADETFASGRLTIWKNIVAMLPEYIWTGTGPDCLMEPYYRHAGLLMGRFVDKAHCEPLQVLITMGLPALLCYVVIYVFAVSDVCSRIKKGNNKPADIALLLAFTGYIVQGMFNISVADVAPYFWIFTGLMAQPLYRQE